MSNTIPHDSIFGGINLFKRFDNRFVIDKGERPPYPIIQSNPTTMEVVHNLNKADLGIILFVAAIGIF